MDDLSPSQCDALLERQHVARIGVLSEGEPYVTPVSFVRDGDAVVFRTGIGRRLDAIRNEPWVCFEVSHFEDATGRWESVLIWGNAYEVVDHDRKTAVIEKLLQKYFADGGAHTPSASEAFPGMTSVVAVPIEKITGKASGSGFGPRTRPGRL